MNDAAEKACPYCAETIKAAAVVCKHCGRELQPPPVRRIFEDSPPPSGPVGDAASGSQTLLRLLVLIVVVPAVALIFSTLGESAAFLSVAALALDGVCLYFLPAYEARVRDHTNFTGVLLLNLFLGWTLIGWVAALVWGVSRQTPQ